MGRPRIEHRVDGGVELKWCGDCDRWFPLDRFRRDASRWDRLGRKCKACGDATTKRCREANLEACREKDRRYAVENRERKTAARTAWRARNRERDEVNRQRYLERNRERVRELDRARQIRERDRRLAYNRLWYRANREHALEQVHRWRLENPDVAQRNSARSRARRRARMYGLPTDGWTIEQLIARDGLVCWINGCTVGEASGGRRDWAVDHLIPIAVDVPDHPGDVLANLGIACHPCNAWKAARLLPAAVARYETNLRAELEAA